MAFLNVSNISHLQPKESIFPTIIHKKPSLLYSFKTNYHGMICCSLKTQVVPQSEKDRRRSANYKPTSWSYEFLQSLRVDHSDSMYKTRAEVLEREIRCVINEELHKAGTTLSLIEMIDDIQRLGLGHRLEMDIRKVLDNIVYSENVYYVAKDTSSTLHATALRFRLLRQHGYQISQDEFKSFMDEKGDFLGFLCEDIEGMLSLHQASFLAVTGEDIMDEALEFTRKHLKNHVDINKDQAEEVRKALDLPVHRKTLRQESREYIETYSQKAQANPRILELAKLDFNTAQLILQSDLQDMSRWWKDIGLANKLEFARDRLMECFFWTVGMVPHPEFSKCRKGLTKVTALITTIDDVYDIYGTMDELELFTNTVERWDVNAVNDLPDYMKLCFLVLYNTVNELAYDTLKVHGQNILPYLTKAWSDMLKAFLVEAKWCEKKDTPTFKNYLKNAWVSVSGILIMTHAYFLMTPRITNEALESLEQGHDLILRPSLVFRLCNDLGTSKAEQERGESASSLLCYMKEKGCLEDAAREHVNVLIDECWKKMNENGRPDEHSPFDKHFVETAINLARISHCTYLHGDAHGSPDDRAKNRIASLILEPISIAG